MDKIDSIPRFPVSVHLLIMDNRKILLSQRSNTGFEDGNYCTIAGKLEYNESVLDGIIREAKEEINILVSKASIVHVMNRKGFDCNRVDYFFVADEWYGIPSNNEPDKCCRIQWFDLNNLPDNIVPYVKFAINEIQKGNHFSLYGWS